MRRITSPRARLFCVCVRNRSMRAIARRRVVGLSWRLQESKKRFQWAIPPIPRSRKQLSVSIYGYSANQKQIPFRYLGHPTKPKTTLCLNLRILRESKNGFRFVTSGTPRSQKQPSVSISGYSANQKTDFVSLPRTFHEAQKTLCLNLRTLRESKNRFRFVTSSIPRSRKQLSVSISGHFANQKTDSVSLPRTLHESKNRFRFVTSDTPRIKKQIPFRYLGHSTKPKTTFFLNLRTLRESNNRFRFVTSSIPRSRKQPFYLNLRTLRETKNESQFRSPGTMQSEKRISILTSEYSGSKK